MALISCGQGFWGLMFPDFSLQSGLCMSRVICDIVCAPLPPLAAGTKKQVTSLGFKRKKLSVSSFSAVFFVSLYKTVLKCKYVVLDRA